MKVFFINVPTKGCFFFFSYFFGMPIYLSYRLFEKNMKISQQNKNFSSETKTNLHADEKLAKSQSLPAENSSIINASADVLTLSETAIKAYFKSQAASLGQTIVTKKLNGTTFTPSPATEAATVDITGSKNIINDSTKSDLIYAKGTSNQFNDSTGSDEIFIVGSKNKIQGYNNTIQTVILGDTNQINITGSGAVSAVISGITNKVVSDSGADFIVLNGTRNNISSGTGDDSIITYGTDNLINAGAGNDVVVATGQNFNISAGLGNDTISTDGAGKINGEEGDDIIEVKGSGNTVYGGAGKDTIQFYSGTNNISGDEGDDTFKVKLSTGSATLDGGKDTDTIQLDFKRSDYAVINGDSDVTFYQLSDHTKKLKITYKNVEQFQFSDNEKLSLAEIKNLKGITYQINPSKDKTTVNNTDAATNVFDLNVPAKNITKSVKNGTGVKITYLNSQNQIKTIQAQGFNYLKVNTDQYIDLKTSPNFEYLDVTPSDSYVISSDLGSGRYRSRFYDKTSESLLLTKDYAEKDSNFLFKDGSFLTATQLLSSYSGKSVDVTTETTEISPTTPTTNIANLKFSSDKIYRIDKVSADNFKLYFKKSDTETGTISFKNITSITTNEGDQLSLSTIYQNAATIRSNEQSHTSYASDSKNTEFKRIAYNLTGKIAYLGSLIDGDYENLSTEKKAALAANAAILENSLTFSSDYADKKVDESTKKLYTFRTANLLKNRSDVLQNLTDSGLQVYFTKDQDLGGDSTGFTTGYATYFTTGAKTKYEAHFVLSAFYGGIFDGNDGDSVDIHETLHIIDFRSEKEEGLPYGITSTTKATYIKERDVLFAKYNQTKSDVGVLRKYGFTNNEEFLAVASENFYERPTDLKTTSSALYSSLAEYFKTT